MSGDRKPMVRLTTVWQRKSKAGNTYFSGFLSGCQLLIFRGDDLVRPDGEVVRVWNVMLQEKDAADSRPRQTLPKILPPLQTRTAERGQAVHDRARADDRDLPFYDDTDAAVRDLTGEGDQ